MDVRKTQDDNSVPTEQVEHAHSPVAPTGVRLGILSLAALGVVYGDIGTSPLYAMRECFNPPHGTDVTIGNIYGVLSLIVWALILVVSVKYMIFILRADNRGEGGILALTALATPVKAMEQSRRWLLVVMGVFGAALLYGDGIITPAISVLSAVEGLKIATPFFDPYIIPITIAILVALFMVQRFGTGGIGKFFGPIMVVWFSVLAALGVAQIVRNPSILLAANPIYAVNFFLHDGWHGFLILGSVFLVVTGGEAIYADMGHFGKRPVRVAWFALVLPALLLNYFGQGVLMLENPETAVNPLYKLAPDWAIYPLVILATMATVIASQALISGAFSITMQAVQLGFTPRLQIRHTSSTEYGQIYMPAVNWALMVGCIALVLIFRSSTALAAAYGIAVTSTMAITTITFYIVMRDKWKWSLVAAGGLTALFLVVDLAFFGANALKILDGGWMPIALGVFIFTIMTTWKRGQRSLHKEMVARLPNNDEFLNLIVKDKPVRVKGTGVFMTGNTEAVPPALMQHYQCSKSLPEQIILLHVETKMTPTVAAENRATVKSLGQNFYSVKLDYGFMEQPNIPDALSSMNAPEFTFDQNDLIYFLGRQTILPSDDKPGMAIWREKVYALLSRNATSATAYFCLPADKVVEMVTHVEI